MERSHTASANRVSERALEIEPFIVMEVMERAFELERAGRSIIHLEVGEPDFETPAVIRDAGMNALRSGHTHYTHSLGRPELRKAIADWYGRRYEVAVSPDHVVVTVGSSGAMLLCFAALLNPGDEVLLPDPGYACYPKFVRVCEGVAISVPLDESSNFEMRASELEPFLTDRTRALVVNSPSNPTGTLAGRECLADLTATLGERLTIISDEIYHGLVYEGRAHSILEFSSQAIVLNGFSKLFAMTGWRLGYAILPPGMIRAVQKLQQNLFISAPDFAQVAAVAALTRADEAVESMRREYDRRRRYVLQALTRMGLRPAGRPAGAFYVLIDVSRFTDDVLALSFRILEEAGVAVTPGVDFGKHGEGYIRICYATAMEKLEEGLSRLGRFFAAGSD